MASGATPAIAEYEKYYSDSENGYPFIRVQNLSDTGILKLEDTKYINPDTHNNYLKRSKVSSDDLLVKITGVGRMAVASVPPTGFEGNINQHIVVIKTDNRYKSEILAAFLNSDIGEKLASRRATGGTRPALDYPALRSIPIIFNQEILDISKKAQFEKQSAESKAYEILSHLEDYLLQQLGIVLPTIPAKGDLSYITSFRKVSGNRFDPKKYSRDTRVLYDAIRSSNYPKAKLKELIVHGVSGDWGNDLHEDFNSDFFMKTLVIRATEFDNNFNLNLHPNKIKYRLISTMKLNQLDVRPGDILLEKSGGSPDQPVGRVALVEEKHTQATPIGFSNFIYKFRVNPNVVVPEYLYCFLKLIHSIKITDAMQSQTNGIRNLIMREYMNQDIILPDSQTQKKIADHFIQKKKLAKEYLENSEKQFERRKKEIDEIILQ